MFLLICFQVGLFRRFARILPVKPVFAGCRVVFLQFDEVVDIVFEGGPDPALERAVVDQPEPHDETGNQVERHDEVNHRGNDCYGAGPGDVTLAARGVGPQQSEVVQQGVPDLYQALLAVPRFIGRPVEQLVEFPEGVGCSAVR